MPPPGFLPLPTSEGVASTSSAPAATSMPKMPRAHARVPLSIPIAPNPSGRMGFLTDPIQVSKYTLASSLVGLDKEGDAGVDKEIKEIVGEVTRKHGAQPGEKRRHNGEEESDADGSTTDKWTAMDLEAVHKNRYSMDLPEMADYCRNYLTALDKTTFNLKDHSKYINIILVKPGITCDVVFTREGR